MRSSERRDGMMLWGPGGGGLRPPAQRHRAFDAAAGQEGGQEPGMPTHLQKGGEEVGMHPPPATTYVYTCPPPPPFPLLPLPGACMRRRKGMPPIITMVLSCNF